MTYEENIILLEAGKIDYLTFLRNNDPELYEMFLDEMRRKKEEPTSSIAEAWVSEYENKTLYNQEIP